MPEVLMVIMICSFNGNECDVATVVATQAQCLQLQEEADKSKTISGWGPLKKVYCLSK